MKQGARTAESNKDGQDGECTQNGVENGIGRSDSDVVHGCIDGQRFLVFVDAPVL